MQRLCVFCGSCDGFDPIYREAAISLAQTLAREGIGLVYGGGIKPRVPDQPNRLASDHRPFILTLDLR